MFVLSFQQVVMANSKKSVQSRLCGFDKLDNLGFRRRETNTFKDLKENGRRYD